MQQIGYITINEKIVLVLARHQHTYVSLKLRATGQPGLHYEDEELFLANKPDKLAKLLAGQVVKC